MVKNTPTRPCQFKAPSVPPEGGLKGSWQGPPSGRHATLEGEYHPLKLNLSGQKYPDQALSVQGSLGATRAASFQGYLQAAISLPANQISLTSPLAKNQSVAKVFTQDYHVEAEKSEII